MSAPGGSLDSRNQAILESHPVLWLAVGFAAIAALAYLLIAWNLLGVGDLQTGEGPTGIVYAAAAYLIGGALILVPAGRCGSPAWS